MKKLILLLFLLSPGALLYAGIDATPEECIALYGKPERDAMQKSGLLYFRKEPLCYILHFYQGRCDVMSIFSSEEEMGVPVELSDEQIKTLLQKEGSQDGSVAWNPVARFSINGVWTSSDRRSFAIYDTMRHKLAIMTRAAYKREKEAKADMSRDGR